MERDDETGAVPVGDDGTTGRRTGATDGERTTARPSGGGRTAGPNQPDDDGFATGHEEKPDGPEEELQPNFARGNADEDSVDTDTQGRFSEGHEALPDSPEKTVDRRFSEGNEQLPHDK